MRAIILSAGRGSRLRPLTDEMPKPLIEVNGDYLIAHHLRGLAELGVHDVVINVAYRAQQIMQALGDGSRYGVNIEYSIEPETAALETGGGIFQALPLLGDQAFMAISADVYTNYPLQNLPTELKGLAHLVMVPNPVFHPEGDYCLRDGQVCLHEGDKLTYASISVLHPDLFQDCEPGVFKLAPLLAAAMRHNKVTGELYKGRWFNIGDSEQLEQARTCCQ